MSEDPDRGAAQLARLQARLHDALRALISGNLVSPLATWRGWAGARCHPTWQVKLAGIETLCGQIAADAPGRGPDAVRPRNAPPFTLRDAAGILARGYRLLAERLPAGESAQAQVVPFRPLRGFAPTTEDHACPPALVDLHRYLVAECRQDLRAAYLHGSYSTQDPNAYSDLDTLVIIRAAVAIDPDRLLDCAQRLVRSVRYLLCCDLLQHHSHYALTEIDFAWYCDAFFPQALFAYCTELFCDGELAVIATRDSAIERREYLETMCRRFTPVPIRADLRHAFHLKLHLSCFMMLPVLLLQAKNRPCYKRESFELARRWYDPAVWQVMDDVSEIRRDWRQASAAKWGRVASVHPLLRALLVTRAGSWGVPRSVFDRVQSHAFQERLRAFAEHTLAIA